jgi:type I restriction enzyme R subunit
MLYALLDPAVDRYNELDEDEQDEFKKMLRTWDNLYSFLSQIIPFQDPELEKFFAFSRLLNRKLPKRDIGARMKLDDDVALEYYRLKKIDEADITLEKNKTGEVSATTEAGISRSDETKAKLSEIISMLNDRFATDFDDADKLFFDQIETELVNDETLKSQAKSNSMDNFKFGFDDAFLTKLIDRMEDNKEIFERILGDSDFGSLVKEWMLKRVYDKLNEKE